MPWFSWLSSLGHASLGMAHRQINKAYRFLVNRKLLGLFLKHDVDLDKLNLDLQNGQAVLEDLQFKEDIFNEILAGSGLQVIRLHVGRVELSGPWSNISLVSSVQSYYDKGTGNLSDCTVKLQSLHLSLQMIPVNKPTKPDLSKSSVAMEIAEQNLKQAEGSSDKQHEDDDWNDYSDSLSALEAASDGREQLIWLVKRALLQFAVEVHDLRITLHHFKDGAHRYPTSLRFRIPFLEFKNDVGHLGGRMPMLDAESILSTKFGRLLVFDNILLEYKDTLEDDTVESDEENPGNEKSSQPPVMRWQVAFDVKSSSSSPTMLLHFHFARKHAPSRAVKKKRKHGSHDDDVSAIIDGIDINIQGISVAVERQQVHLLSIAIDAMKNFGDLVANETRFEQPQTSDESTPRGELFSSFKIHMQIDRVVVTLLDMYSFRKTTKSGCGDLRCILEMVHFRLGVTGGSIKTAAASIQEGTTVLMFNDGQEGQQVRTIFKFNRSSEQCSAAGSLQSFGPAVQTEWTVDCPPVINVGAVYTSIVISELTRLLYAWYWPFASLVLAGGDIFSSKPHNEHAEQSGEPFEFYCSSFHLLVASDNVENKLLSVDMQGFAYLHLTNRIPLTNAHHNSQCASDHSTLSAQKHSSSNVIFPCIKFLTIDLKMQDAVEVSICPDINRTESIVRLIPNCVDSSSEFIEESKLSDLVDSVLFSFLKDVGISQGIDCKLQYVHVYLNKRFQDAISDLANGLSFLADVSPGRIDIPVAAWMGSDNNESDECAGASPGFEERPMSADDGSTRSSSVMSEDMDSSSSEESDSCESWHQRLAGSKFAQSSMMESSLFHSAISGTESSLQGKLPHLQATVPEEGAYLGHDTEQSTSYSPGFHSHMVLGNNLTHQNSHYADSVDQRSVNDSAEIFPTSQSNRLIVLRSSRLLIALDTCSRCADEVPMSTSTGHFNGYGSAAYSDVKVNEKLKSCIAIEATGVNFSFLQYKMGLIQEGEEGNEGSTVWQVNACETRIVGQNRYIHVEPLFPSCMTLSQPDNASTQNGLLSVLSRPSQPILVEFQHILFHAMSERRDATSSWVGELVEFFSSEAGSDPSSNVSSHQSGSDSEGVEFERPPPDTNVLPLQPKESIRIIAHNTAVQLLGISQSFDEAAKSHSSDSSNDMTAGIRVLLHDLSVGLSFDLAPLDGGLTSLSLHTAQLLLASDSSSLITNSDNVIENLRSHLQHCLVSLRHGRHVTPFSNLQLPIVLSASDSASVEWSTVDTSEWSKLFGFASMAKLHDVCPLLTLNKDRFIIDIDGARIECGGTGQQFSRLFSALSKAFSSGDESNSGDTFNVPLDAERSPVLSSNVQDIDTNVPTSPNSLANDDDLVVRSESNGSGIDEDTFLIDSGDVERLIEETQMGTNEVSETDMFGLSLDMGEDNDASLDGSSWVDIIESEGSKTTYRRTMNFVKARPAEVFCSEIEVENDFLTVEKRESREAAERQNCETDTIFLVQVSNVKASCLLHEHVAPPAVHSSSSKTSTDHVQIEIDGLKFSARKLGTNPVLEWMIDASVTSIVVHDHVASSVFHTVAGPWEDVAHTYDSSLLGRSAIPVWDSRMPMLSCSFQLLRPQPQDYVDDARVYIHVQPMAVSLDQDTLDMLADWFLDWSQSAHSRSSEDNDMDELHDNSIIRPASRGFQTFRISRLPLLINFKPKPRMRQVGISQLLQLLSLKDAQLCLREIRLHCVEDAQSLIQIWAKIWAADLYSKQLLKLLTSMPGLRNASNVVAAIGRLLEVSSQDSGRDVRRKMLGLVVALTAEALDVSTSISSVLDRLLSRMSAVLADSNTSGLHPSSQFLNRDIKSLKQPGSVKQGLKFALDSCHEGVAAAIDVVTGGSTNHSQEGSSMDTNHGRNRLGQQIRHRGPPIASMAVDSLRGFNRAIFNVLTGVRNTVDPRQVQRHGRKYKQ